MIIDPGSPGFNKSNSATSGGAKLSRSQSEPSSVANAGETSAKSSSDSVSLSSKARALGRLEQAVHQSNDIDAAKVAKVKQAIADGQYHPNSNSIAERMLSQDSLF